MKLEATPLGRIAGELGQEVRKADAQFDKDGALYQPVAHNTDAATKIVGALANERADEIAKSLLHLELKDEGSGTASSPGKAGYALTASVFKEGFPDASARDGEIDTILLTFRQRNGDAAAILANGSIINGFGTFYEGHTQNLDPATFEIQHKVTVTAAVINDTGTLVAYGHSTVKRVGIGGYAIQALSDPGAAWEYNLMLRHENNTQLTHRVSDSTLFLHQYGTPANFYGLSVVSGKFRLTDKDGNVSALEGAPADYTPVATGGNGAAVGSGATITGRSEQLTTRTRRVSLRAVVPDLGSMAAGIRLTLPVAASSATDGYAVWMGQNLSTGAPVQGLILPGGTYVLVTAGVSPYGMPITAGQSFRISGVYETA